MVKIVGISGSRVKQGNMDALLKFALAEAEQQPDVETEFISVVGKEIGPCIHCNWCLRKQSDGKFCSQDDDMASIYPKVLEADGLILASPAHFGRLSGSLADVVDRLRVFVHGNEYSHALKDKIGGSLAVGFYRGGGIESTLSSINSAFFALEMILASSVLYHYGAAGVTSRDGAFQKDPRHLVLEDKVGTRSAKALADRMVELARIVKVGKEQLAGGQYTTSPCNK